VSAVDEVRDVVSVHVTADLPIRARALPFADRVEIRFGKAFPVVLIIDRAALGPFDAALHRSQADLDAATDREVEG
jgi:hypothetical protein